VFAARRHSIQNRQKIVSVDNLARHAITHRRGSNVCARRIASAGGCRQAIAVVFHDENHRQFPHGGQADGFVEVAFPRGAFAAERKRYELRVLQ
jgi:hypothetical protein